MVIPREGIRREEDGLRELDNAERIGVIGSPSSTHSLTIDILGTAVDKRLVGGLCIFRFKQDNREHYALGQITEIRLRNIWSEDPTMRSLIRQKGRVDPITERQDTHTATMLVSSVFSKTENGIEAGMLGTVPPTGTYVRLVNGRIMRALLARYIRESFYLGSVYGSEVLLPMWFKHFGDGEGGVGEAYHIGVFGKTGSGKSVLTKMIMLGYAKHREMTIFVIDPQGEFAKLRRDKRVMDIINSRLRKELVVYDLNNLVLSDKELFEKILVISGFFNRLGIYHEDNKERAAYQIREALRKFKPSRYHERSVFDFVLNKLREPAILSRIYSSQDPQNRVRDYLDGVMRDTSAYNDLYMHWRRVANLFADNTNHDTNLTAYKDKEGGTKKIDDLAEEATREARGQIIIINLSESEAPDDILWTDDIRMIVINEFLRALKEEAARAYKEGKLLNTLVIIDEAHRLAPREKQENPELENVKNTLKDAVRTTRKYGLGWMFVSQTIYSLDKEIINQMRIYIFGYGLAYGVELQALREIIGGNEEAIALYQSFKDPQSTLNKRREYSFMTVGPISPLSFSGIPLFFQSLQYPDEFIDVNFPDIQ